jgi:hypothetical protein
MSPASVFSLRPASDTNEDSRPASARRTAEQSQKRRHIEDELEVNSDNDHSQASPLRRRVDGSRKRQCLPVVEDGNDDETSEDDARFGADDMSYRKSVGLDGGHDINHSWVNAVRSHYLLHLEDIILTQSLERSQLASRSRPDDPKLHVNAEVLLYKEE